GPPPSPVRSSDVRKRDLRADTPNPPLCLSPVALDRRRSAIDVRTEIEGHKSDFTHRTVQSGPWWHRSARLTNAAPGPPAASASWIAGTCPRRQTGASRRASLLLAARSRRALTVHRLASPP